MRMQVPESLIDQALAYVDGRAQPATPRNAATVVLLRDSVSGPEAYLLRRQASMAFAAGMAVFPGGGVDERDFDADESSWIGPSAATWAAALAAPEDLAKALVCAAVRETFEESGVLLAGEHADDVVADTTGADWEADRAALERRDLAFSDFLTRRGLRLRTDLLGVWSGWLTPVFEPRRYRTWFFVAALPAGQRTRDVSTESSDVQWLPLMDAVAATESNDLLMLPPTYLTCLEMGQHPSVAEVMKAAEGRVVEMFTPQVEEGPEGTVLSIPDSLDALLRTRT